MEEEHRSPLFLIVVSGSVFVVSVCIFTFIALNPEFISALFGKEQGDATTVMPVAPSNGTVTPSNERTALPHTKHYANAFFSFDYPESFSIVDERTNQDTDGTSAYGSNEVTLVASSSDERYIIRVASSPSLSDMPAESAVESAKSVFMARTERGPNDSIQDITVDGGAAYKDYVEGTIHIGVPKGKMRYDASIEWENGKGSKGSANYYLGNIEDSFSGL